MNEFNPEETVASKADTVAANINVVYRKIEALAEYVSGRPVDSVPCDVTPGLPGRLDQSLRGLDLCNSLLNKILFQFDLPVE